MTKKDKQVDNILYIILHGASIIGIGILLSYYCILYYYTRECCVRNSLYALHCHCMSVCVCIFFFFYYLIEHFDANDFQQVIRFT